MIEATSALEAKQLITEGLYRYCRAIDRMDRELLATVFHEDAPVDFPYYSGSWEGFVDWVWPSHEQFAIHSHQVTNILIELQSDGHGAESESYVTASLWQPATDGEEVDGSVAPGHDVVAGTRTGVEHCVRARYLDRWSLRDGRWAIAYRRCVVDLQTISTTTGLTGEGRRDRLDPSYRSAAARPA